MYLLNIIERKARGRREGGGGELRKSFVKMVLIEYHSGLSLFFPTQAPPVICIIIATHYLSPELTSSHLCLCDLIHLLDLGLDLCHRSHQSV